MKRPLRRAWPRRCGADVASVRKASSSGLAVACFRTSAKKCLTLVGAGRSLCDDQVDQPIPRLPLHRQLGAIHLMVGDNILQLVEVEGTKCFPNRFRPAKLIDPERIDGWLGPPPPSTRNGLAQCSTQRPIERGVTDGLRYGVPEEPDLIIPRHTTATGSGAATRLRSSMASASYTS